MSPTIEECLERARQCEWYAARTNDGQDRKFLLRKLRNGRSWPLRRSWKFEPLRGRPHKLLGRPAPKGTKCSGLHVCSSYVLLRQ